MDILSNLNKNIFGENNKHDSNSIDFSAQPVPVKKDQKIFEAKSDKLPKEQNVPKIIKNSNNLSEIKKEKPKVEKKADDSLSYSKYNKNALKNISDPLSQMKPNTTFGYPTKKKENKDSENKKQNKDKKEKEKNDLTKNNVNAKTNINTNDGNQKAKETMMANIFGDYSNINKNKVNNNVTQPILNNQNVSNNNNLNAANLQLNANMMMNYMNLLNIQNPLNQQNMLLNMYQNNNINNNLNNNMNPNLNNNVNANLNNLNKNPNTNTKPVTLNLRNTPNKTSNILNVERNELGQVYKIGDLYSDTDLIRKKLNIMETETIKDISKATLNVPDIKFMGVLVLTDFRLIFKMENEKYLNNNYSEDYFKIPLFLISKIEKVQDKKMSFNAIPIEITLKDTRVIKFHLYDLQRFYYNLSDLTNPIDYKQFYEFPRKYNKIKFQGKNVTNGWNIYNPIIEFSRQGVTEDNDLGLKYCYINQNFAICPTYPEFLIEPKDISDEELIQTSKYRSKGRLPIFTYYYNGNADNTNLKVTPSIWRSAQNKRGLMGNKSSPADVKLLNSISKFGGGEGKGKLYIYDCRPKLNAFVNRVGGGGYEKEGDYDNATLYFCEIDNIHKARKALNGIYSLCLSNKINDYNNFWTSLEQTDWYQFIYLMLKYANEISKTLQANHSVLIHCSDGWDRTAQLSSLSQLLLDPFYRTINGFAILIEKDWLSFGHQFGLRNGFSEKEKQEQASPIFLQFLDAVHQLLEQFPNAFEFNEKFLLFLARNYSLNLYGTFLYNNEKERKEQNAKTETASVWTEIFCDLKPYLNIYYDANSVKILEPNYSYYNLKLWTALFMENNIYLENNHFFANETDKSISFKSKQEFFAYKKKEDESKFMSNQNKYDELLKTTAEIYFLIKDNKGLFDDLSKDSKKLIEELKPEMEKINKSRIMKKELVDKLKAKKEVIIENKKEDKNEIKESIIKIDKKEDKKEEIKEEKKEDKKEEIKEEKKEEKKEDKKDEKTNEEGNKDKETSPILNENNDKKDEKKDEIKNEIRNEETKNEENSNKTENKEEIKKEENEIGKNIKEEVIQGKKEEKKE